jgi:hypothetical protein
MPEGTIERALSLVQFAYAVDTAIHTLTGRARSSFSRTQKEVADQLICDHHAAGSSIAETASIVWGNMKALEE